VSSSSGALFKRPEPDSLGAAIAAIATPWNAEDDRRSTRTGNMLDKPSRWTRLLGVTDWWESRVVGPRPKRWGIESRGLRLWTSVNHEGLPRHDLLGNN
jgi:hypothetical protein